MRKMLKINCIVRQKRLVRLEWFDWCCALVLSALWLTGCAVPTKIENRSEIILLGPVSGTETVSLEHCVLKNQAAGPKEIFTLEADVRRHWMEKRALKSWENHKSQRYNLRWVEGEHPEALLTNRTTSESKRTSRDYSESSWKRTESVSSLIREPYTHEEVKKDKLSPLPESLRSEKISPLLKVSFYDKDGKVVHSAEMRSGETTKLDLLHIAKPFYNDFKLKVLIDLAKGGSSPPKSLEFHYRMDDLVKRHVTSMDKNAPNPPMIQWNPRLTREWTNPDEANQAGSQLTLTAELSNSPSSPSAAYMVDCWLVIEGKQVSSREGTVLLMKPGDMKKLSFSVELPWTAIPHVSKVFLHSKDGLGNAVPPLMEEIQVHPPKDLPFLILESARFQKNGDGQPCLRVEIHNTGSGPARKVRVSATLGENTGSLVENLKTMESLESMQSAVFWFPVNLTLKKRADIVFTVQVNERLGMEPVVQKRVVPSNLLKGFK